MATRTPSNEGGSSSGISDVKYQKAIKQISKLISLNTTLKNDYVKLQQKYDKLQQDYDILEQKLNNFEFQAKGTNETTAYQFPSQPKLNENSISKFFKDNSQVSEDITEFVQQKNKIQQLEERLKEREEKIQKMKVDLDSKQKQIQQHRRKQIDMSQQLTRIKLAQSMLKQNEHSQKQALKLKKQLQRSQQLVKKISSDYEFLKKQLLFNDKSSINAKSIQMNNSTPTSPGGSLRDPLSDFYLQKLRKSESENIKLRKQYQQKKQKWKSISQKLKNDNQQQLKKLIHLTSFVEKQQAFIEKFVLDKPQSCETIELR